MVIISLRQCRVFTKRYADALWRWRKIKAQTKSVSTSIEKEFLSENTALTTKLISQKLDELEKIVKEGPSTFNDKLERQSTYNEIDTLIRQRSLKRSKKDAIKNRFVFPCIINVYN